MSVSGLTPGQRHIARQRTVQAALLGYHHRANIHYTQDSRRWEGIAHHCVAQKGQYPNYADCSAYVTWCLWNGLHIAFGKPDIVNGCNWGAGFTGTLAQHGMEIHRPGLLPGDIALYGAVPTFEHTAIVVGWQNKQPVVVSHGSEGGPYLIPAEYRPVSQFRRYI